MWLHERAVMKKYDTWLHDLRCCGLKYADLPADTFKKLIPVARKHTEFEYAKLGKLLKSCKNLQRSSGSQSN